MKSSTPTATPAWVRVAWYGILLFFLLTVSTTVVRADHPWTGPWKHLNNIHTNSTGQGSQDEEFCVESFTGSVSSATALARVKTAFYESGYPRWDGLQYGNGSADWRVDIWAKSSKCSSYPQNERNSIEFEVHVYEDNGWICGSGFSCVTHDLPVWYNGGAQPHTDYEWAYIYLDAQHTTSPHLVNHEMGHVLGLRDGDGSCPGSIMHDSSYGCGGNQPRPASIDIDTMRWLVTR